MFQTKDLQQIRARFWQDKLSRIKTDDDVRRFVSIYLPLFAKDLADLCLDALSHLSQVDSDSAHRVADWVASDQDLTESNLADLAGRVGLDGPVREGDFKLFQPSRALATLAGVTNYFCLKKRELEQELFLDYDIAYSIVVLASYNDDLVESNQMVNQIWDLATDLEVPIRPESERRQKKVAMLELIDELY